VDEFLTEAEQWERAKAWLRSYLPWILGGIVVALAGLAGWNWWRDRQDSLGVQASALYEQMTDALQKNDPTRAKSIAASLEKQYPDSPYVDQAHLFEARLAIEANDLAKADSLLRGIMDHTDDEQLALVARLRLARVQLAQNKPDDALATLNAKPAGAFEGRFHEVRGDVLFAKGDKPGALKEYLSALAQSDARSVDTQTLQLKINDLKTADASAPAAPAPANGAK
jgi:predicted negative regulator of RcsB-dependent stress response